jgi:predicted molibdopterin-dependent oxidoreductase YjgC
MSDSTGLTLVLDGEEVDFTRGETLFEVADRHDKEIPTLCYLETLEPANACRLCVVEVEGGGALVPSCSRELEEGMRVQTDSERVRHSRRMILELLAATVDLSIVEVGDLVDEYGAEPDRLGLDGSEEPAVVDNPLYVRDLDRCVLCYRCVDVCGEQAQNTFAITVAGRGGVARIATEFDVALPESACVFCGNCVAVCPTGALIGRTEFDMRQAGTWDSDAQHITRTICPYCGVGCNLDLHVQDNQIVKVTSPLDHDVTLGNLCIKGRFGYSHVER